MNDSSDVSLPRSDQRAKRIALWFGGSLVLVCIICFAVAEYLLHQAEPILRARVIETLSTRFDSHVELREFHASVLRGLEVSGAGLQIDRPGALSGSPPLATVENFSFHTGIVGLFQTPMHVSLVHVKGLRLDIPPKGQRPPLSGTANSSGKHAAYPKVKIAVDEIACENTVLLIESSKPGKDPLEFDISSLLLKGVGPGQSMEYNASLRNPKPVGDILAQGHFGPWHNDNPGDTPLSGSYTFSHADLATTKGIAGILSSTGSFTGNLDHLVVDGKTDTPDFRVSVSGHPVALHTDFHAIVDGTNGDTYLQPVQARFLHSAFTAQGSITRKQGVPGHTIDLDVVMNQARIEDLLRLGVKTEPPVLTGAVQLKTKLFIPPGPAPIDQKLYLKGRFHISGAHFTNDKVQQKVDILSLVGQGRRKETKGLTPENHAALDVDSELQGDFDLQNGRLDLSAINFDVPGANIKLGGLYTLDGNQFDFHGKARLQARVSEIVGGTAGIFLKLVDPFFAKNGAGTEVPFKVSGTKSDPKFGLDFGHKDDKDSSKSGHP